MQEIFLDQPLSQSQFAIQEKILYSVVVKWGHGQAHLDDRIHEQQSSARQGIRSDQVSGTTRSYLPGRWKISPTASDALPLPWRGQLSH